MAIYATGCLCCLLLAGTSCATGEEPVYDNPLRTSAGDTVRLPILSFTKAMDFIT